MPKKQNVLCINDGIVYESMSDAAKKYGIAQSAISRQIKGERRTAKGYYFVAVSNPITKAGIKRCQKEYMQKLLKMEDDKNDS